MTAATDPGRSPAPASAAATAAASGRWTVVLPLKGGPGAKSRLAGPPGLAGALARDCLTAVLACRRVQRVLVVTSDPATAAWTALLGAEPVRERRPGSGLDAAVRDALAAAEGPSAVLLGDLPALRPQDLDAALAAIEGALGAGGAHQALVPDAEGTGSVLLAAFDADRLTPSFGPGSAARHLAAGAVRLDLDLPRLRQDVDTDADLRLALELGCGPATLEVLAARAPRLG